MKWQNVDTIVDVLAGFDDFRTDNNSEKLALLTKYPTQGDTSEMIEFVYRHRYFTVAYESNEEGYYLSVPNNLIKFDALSEHYFGGDLYIKIPYEDLVRTLGSLKLLQYRYNLSYIADRNRKVRKKCMKYGSLATCLGLVLGLTTRKLLK